MMFHRREGFTSDGLHQIKRLTKHLKGFIFTERYEHDDYKSTNLLKTAENIS